MKFKKRIAGVILLLLSLGTLQAQKASLASGGDASGNGGSVSYSIGQVAYTTPTGNSGSVAQGVQQPFEISIILGRERVHFELAAFPNPTTDNLALTVEAAEPTNITYRVFDLMGHTVRSGQLTSKRTTINMENLSSSTYFLAVSHLQKPIKTFKIIKR